jgi:hypothetical protein
MVNNVGYINTHLSYNQKDFFQDDNWIKIAELAKKVSHCIENNKIENQIADRDYKLNNYAAFSAEVLDAEDSGNMTTFGNEENITDIERKLADLKDKYSSQKSTIK